MKRKVPQNVGYIGIYQEWYSGFHGLDHEPWNSAFKDPRFRKGGFSPKRANPPQRSENGVFLGFWPRRFFREGPWGEAARTAPKRGGVGGVYERDKVKKTFKVKSCLSGIPLSIFTSRAFATVSPRPGAHHTTSLSLHTLPKRGKTLLVMPFLTLSVNSNLKTSVMLVSSKVYLDFFEKLELLLHTP